MMIMIMIMIKSCHSGYIPLVCLHRMLYWTDWSSTSPAIYRSPVVSPSRETLVSGNLVWPSALAIDFTGN